MSSRRSTWALSLLLVAACQPEATPPRDAHAHARDPHEHHTAHHRFDDAAAWSKKFDDPARDAWQKPDEVVTLTSVAPGMTVVDLGAGTGYFEKRLSAAVGPKGKVIALDVEPNMVAFMKQRAEREGLTNVDSWQCPPDSTGLAPASVDRILVVDTWHHLEKREAYAKHLAETLVPGGSVVVVDFTKESPKGPPKQHKLAAEVIVRELTAAGLTARVADETLPDQYVVIATKAAPATQPKAPAMDSAAQAEAWSRVLASVPKKPIKGFVVFSRYAPRSASAARARARSGTLPLAENPSVLMAAKVVREDGDAVEVQSLPRAGASKAGKAEPFDRAQCVEIEPLPTANLDLTYWVRKSDLVPVLSDTLSRETDWYRLEVASGTPVVMTDAGARLAAAVGVPLDGVTLSLSYAAKGSADLEHGDLDFFTSLGPIEVFGERLGAGQSIPCTSEANPSRWCVFRSQCSTLLVKNDATAPGVSPALTGSGESITLGGAHHYVRERAVVTWRDGRKAGTVFSATYLFKGSTPKSLAPAVERTNDGRGCVAVPPFDEPLCFRLVPKDDTAGIGLRAE